MCNFLSALVLRSGEVLTHWALDSHSELVRYFRLPDNSECRHFAKVELRPNVEGADWFDAETWKWTLDEETSPSWWEDVAGAAERALRARAAKMILRDGEHNLVVEGCWIVGGAARLRDVRGGRIIMMGGSASIRNVWGSASISNVGDSASIRNVRDSVSLDDSAKSRAGVPPAAVHLLAAALRVRDHCPADPVINPEWNAAWDALLAAIAKAEGRS